MEQREIYLDTYILQQDMRIRLPKSILSNLKNVEKGVTLFDIFLSAEDNALILRLHTEKDGEGIF